MVSPELARHLTETSRRLNRQVGVLLGRDGNVRNVIVGDAHSLTLPDIGRLRGGVGRFRGLRLVHTHLKGEPLTRDDLNDLALLRLDLVAAIEVLPDGLPGKIDLAHLAPFGLDGYDQNGHAAEPFERIQAADVHQLRFDPEAVLKALEDEFARLATAAGETEKERALVIGITPEDEHFEE
ncbi:MAG TPA: GTPase HflX, partial [Thermoanaerobaculia bacterium]|nr:GTPase HflX [Thermoanaerobaculia bacterium]